MTLEKRFRMWINEHNRPFDAEDLFYAFGKESGSLDNIIEKMLQSGELEPAPPMAGPGALKTYRKT